MSTLTIHTRPNQNAAGQNTITLELEGNLDSFTVASLEAQLQSVLAAKPQQLIFDLAALKFITSAGIKLFLIAAKQQKKHGDQIAFVHLQPQIKDVFSIMGSIADMRIFKDQAELDAYLLTRQQTLQQRNQ